MSEHPLEKPLVRLLASEENWIEGEAVRQLEKTAELPGIFMAIGLPELHPGKGVPIGAVFAGQRILYPHLVGNDVGCGMGLWQTDLKRRKIKRDRWAERLSDLEGPWDGELAPWLGPEELAPGPFDLALGTIGGGNHFAELQQVERVEEPEAFRQLGLEADGLVLLVHSGSRGLGEVLRRSQVERHGAGGLAEDSSEADHYRIRHDQALRWARANRALIAHRFLAALGAEGRRVLDRYHNHLSPGVAGGRSCWIHRKGAVDSTEGATVIAGSRASLSYLVLPAGDQELCAHSLTHGAGRKWRRGDCKGRLRSRYRPEDMIYTDLGSRVICEDRELLYEEAPQAYKNVEIVVKDLRDAGLIRVVAAFRPIITYKTRKSAR